MIKIIYIRRGNMLDFRMETFVTVCKYMKDRKSVV